MIRHLAAIATIAALPFFAQAQGEPPKVGFLYSTTERHSLTYRCEPPTNSRLVCSFEQANVRPKSTIGDLSASIAQAKKEYSPNLKASKQECESYRELVAVLVGQKKAAKPEALEAMTAVERRDNLEAGKALLGYCEKPNEESHLKIAQIELEKNRRTCIVSVHTYQQTFRHLPSKGSSGSWVVDSSPDGPCGIVQLTRFEAENLKLENRTATLWKYIARKAVTNPNGTIGAGAKCSGFDEGTYVYDWRPITHQLTCDYIEFAPL